MESAFFVKRGIKINESLEHVVGISTTVPLMENDIKMNREWISISIATSRRVLIDIENDGGLEMDV